LAIPGAEQLTGRGIYYGAALVEAAACKDENVYIIGGANSAGQAALHFSKFACQVTMLVRARSLEASMSKYLIDEIERTSNIVVEPNTQVLSAEGEEHLQALNVRSPEGDSRRETSSLFVFIGAMPGTEWLPDVMLRDEKGFVLAGPDLTTAEMKAHGQFARLWKENRDPFLLESSVPGIFVAGDVRHGSVKRAASAVGEGSIAVQFAHQYLASF
jgi:thioredoxin reductase (NADPH)